ncbi:MAG: galactose-1-phosphate uridylyltransferase [Candidatus Rokubacteria bacterium]|nr:galactose-1-phosphate uridylyltransferase [Candidatus Rokubacteria bacterium]
MSDLRKDPTSGQWVLVRPPSPALPAETGCPFCPGHEPLTPPEIAAYRKDGSPPDGPGWSVRVIPEADPYFGVERELVREGVGLYDKISPRGATELIIEAPGHDLTPATLGAGQWEQVLWMYRDRLRDLKRDTAIRDILITRRHGKMGSRVTHPYSRLTAIPIIFADARRKLAEAREYYEYKRRCVFCDIVRQEVADEERVVRLTPHFALLVPYAARSPYQITILPRLHACAYEAALSPESAPDLAGLLEGYFLTLSGALGDPQFEMALYTAPNIAAKVLPGEWATLAEDYHWHIDVTPHWERLTRVGGIYVNELPPEEAAGILRTRWASASR